MWLSSVYDPATTNFVNQEIPRELAVLLRTQKIVPLRKSEIAKDPAHAHHAKAASQLTDESSVWMLVAFFLRVRASAEGYTDFPELRHTDYEVIMNDFAGKI